MPTYEYECKNCSHSFEKFQNMTDDTLKKCPECKKNSLKRLIGTGAGIIFKGSGFYETDYRSESYNKDKKKDTEPKAKTDSSKSDKKTETKSTDSKKKKPTPSKTSTAS